MTKLNVASTYDKQIFQKVLEYNLNLLFGNNNQEKKYFYNALCRNLREVTILPYGAQGKFITIDTPGCCWTYANGNSDIEMYGFQNAPYSERKFTIHEFSHELWHSIICLTNYLSTKEKEIDDFDMNGNPIKKHNCSGLIRKSNCATYEVKDLGQMYMETLTDILTSGSLVTNDDSYRRQGANLDIVFKQKYDSWKDAETGYSIFTSLTRLLIAAFSNNGTIGYDATARNGSSIFTCKTTTNTGHTLISNSFLYNFAFNPMAIEEEFDQYLGHGSYERITTQMDEIFDEYCRTRVYTDKMKAIIKDFMIIVSDFTNAKKAYLQNMGIISITESNAIVANYNRIWNSLQREYSSFFTQKDIDDIKRRAYSYYNRPNNGSSRIKKVGTTQPA